MPVSTHCPSHHVSTRLVTPGGVVTTLAGKPDREGGYSDHCSGADALFNAPQGVVIDSSAAILVTDFYNGRVRRISGCLVTPYEGLVDRQLADNEDEQEKAPTTSRYWLSDQESREGVSGNRSP